MIKFKFEQMLNFAILFRKHALALLWNRCTWEHGTCTWTVHATKI